MDGSISPVARVASDLLRYLSATSHERARVIRDLVASNPSMAELLVDLEADYDLRTRFEIELLRAND